MYGFKNFLIRIKGNFGSCALTFTNYRELRNGFAPFISLMIRLPVALYLNLKPLGKGIDYAHPHTVQAAGNLIGLVVKFPPGMQGSQNQLYCRLFLGLMNIHRDAAAVITNTDTVIRMHRYIYFGTIACQRFIYRVVHHFENQMMQA